MVDEKEILKQYSYKATSNLVLEQDRRRRRDRDAGGANAMATGKLPGRMGDRATRADQRSPELQKLLERRRDRAPKDNAPPRAAAELTALDPLAADGDIVDAADDLEIDADGAAYIPSTAVSQRAFEGLLAFVLSKLGDQPRDLLRAAANETLALLKDDALVELDRKKDIEQILGSMDVDEFSRLSMIGRQIKDFRADDEDEPAARAADDIDPYTDVGADGAVNVASDEEAEGSNAGDEEFADEVVELDDEDDERPGDEIYPERETSNDGVDGTDGDAVMSASQSTIKFDPRKVDAFWIQRELSKFYPDAHECMKIADEVLAILSTAEDDRSCEYRLVTLLQFDKFDFLSLLLENRRAIVFCTKFARAKNTDEKAELEHQLLSEEGGNQLLKSIRNSATKDPSMEDVPSSGTKKSSKRERSKKVKFADQTPADNDEALLFGRRKPKFAMRNLDIESLSFQRGGRLMTVRDCRLPEGSEHVESKDYEEWYIPATRVKDSALNVTTIPITQLPEWAQSPFSSTRQLNRMQSTVFPCAFESDENMLLCAPTGAGKTNVAVLTILRALNNAVPDEKLNSGDLSDLLSFKVVYVAPMKALVAEVVENLGKRLGALGLNVRELTGDVNLSKYEIEDTHVIVTTPEKWDIITRKSGEKTYTRMVVLLIIDEIHLLHDERGPVLESIIARTMRNVDSFSSQTRIVGLSATLPNYKDVGSFIRINPDKGLFYFDSSHRPCPLRQCYVGITAKKALKRFQLMNELTYEKVKTQLQSSNQVIVFVHSRKETTSTCQYFVNKTIEEEVSDLLLKPGTGSYEVIQSELPTVSSKDLAGLLQHGLATHHAGMTRNDRQLVEALFEAGHVKVLVSTATLAWGVNLPAHSVIIKGTQVYSPEQGHWVELSSMDVMQMMGRAGRPQFDTFGEGYIITTKADVLYYLSLLNNQLPIESQFISRIIDMLNAEVATGSVSSVMEGSKWLSYTYLYVRMVKNASLYGIATEERNADPTLERRRAELIHAAAGELHRYGLIKYNQKSGEIGGTELGKVAADFYVSHQSMAFYLDRMSPSTTDIDLFRIFSGSSEFRHMQVREEEKLELSRLAERVPIPVKESLDEPSAKVNVLLQAYISNLSLSGLAMRADMVYVTQSAARLARALLHVALQMKCAALVEKCLLLCKNVSARQWATQTPLRQFHESLGMDVVHKIERKDYPFERYYELNSSELGELLKDVKLGRRVHRLLYFLPRLEMDAHVRPLSRSTVEVELILVPNFQFERKFHRGGELFWITVEDADSENLLHSEPFYLRSSLSSEDHTLWFTLQLSLPLPPQYFIRCSSDRWIVPETVLPISFRDLTLPEKFSALSKPLDMHALSVPEAFNVQVGEDEIGDIQDLSAFRETLADCTAFFGTRSSHLSKLLTQLFPKLFESNENVTVAALPDIERDICGELCLARLFSRQPTSVAVWICGKGDISVSQVCKQLADGLGGHLGVKVGSFLSDRSQDLAFIRSAGTIAVTTPEVWDMFSRRWREKRIGKIMKKIGLVILDGVQMVSERHNGGVALEVVGSRMRYIAAELKESGLRAFRIAALSDPIANAKEVGHWLGCPPDSVFSFHPKDLCGEFKAEVVATSLQVSTRELNAPQLTQQVFSSIRKHIGEKNHQAVVYLPSRSLTRSVALEIVSTATLSGKADRFLRVSEETLTAEIDKISTASLKECLKCGVGFIHESLNETEVTVVESLFSSGALLIVIASRSMAWKLRTLDAKLTIIAGAASEHSGSTVTKRMLYNRTDLLRMMFGSKGSKASLRKRTAVLITDAGLASHYKANIMDPLPVESQLPRWLADHLNAEIASGVVESKQDAVDYLTWAFFYRRLPKNPNYYGMKGTSHVDISKHLSELVETVLSDLETSKCVATEGEDDVALGTLNLGIIASHYYLRYATVELFASSIAPNTKLKGVLDILSLASEFDNIPVRVGEEEIVRRLAADAPVALQDGGHVPSFSDPHVKTHILLQAQLSRQNVPLQFAEDQRKIVRKSVHLLKALVDVISSAGWLKPALDTIELIRMLVQGLWDSDSPLIQLPHVDKKLATRLNEEFEVEHIFDFPDMEAEQRSEVLRGLSENEILEMASAYNEIPSLKLDIQSVEQDKDVDGMGMTTVTVVVQRNEDEEEEEGGHDSGGKKWKSVPQVVAPRFPETREEGWWVVVGDIESNSLQTVKHVALKKEAVVKLQFGTPVNAGKHSFMVYLLSDSYIDCDLEDKFEVVVEDVADGGGDDEIEAEHGGNEMDGNLG